MCIVINRVCLLKKSDLSSWVFTAMQSVHIRMNQSFSPPIKNPGSAYGIFGHARSFTSPAYIRHWIDF